MMSIFTYSLWMSPKSLLTPYRVLLCGAIFGELTGKMKKNSQMVITGFINDRITHLKQTWPTLLAVIGAIMASYIQICRLFHHQLVKLDYMSSQVEEKNCLHLWVTLPPLAYFPISTSAQCVMVYTGESAWEVVGHPEFIIAHMVKVFGGVISGAPDRY